MVLVLAQLLVMLVVVRFFFQSSKAECGVMNRFSEFLKILR